jgi:hypothetical protein
LSLFVCGALVGGAVLADEPERTVLDDAQSEEAQERVCFYNRQVRNFDGLSDRFVYVEASGGKNYLLTMRNHCSGLSNARGIAIRDTTNRVCDNGFAEILFRDLGRMQRCRIGEIEPVQNKDAARALVAERTEHEKQRRKSKKEEKADD